MDRRLNARLRWFFHRGLDFLGTPGVFGLGLLACCLAGYLAVLQPAQYRLAELRSQADSRRAELARNKTAQMATVTPEARLSHFYQRFPLQVATPAQLEKLYAAAEASGITLEQGEYRPVSGGGGKFERYQISLPVKGSYPQIRKFIDRLLADLPAASLDGVSFQRQQIGATQVESQIKFTLYRAGGA